MSGGAKAGLTLPWLWVALIIAYIALGFMLPPWDGSLKALSKTKIHVTAPNNVKSQENSLVF